MGKRLFRFGPEYELAYARKIFKIVWVNGGKNLKMTIRPRKHRDAQQWAYRGKTQG